MNYVVYYYHYEQEDFMSLTNICFFFVLTYTQEMHWARDFSS